MYKIFVVEDDPVIAKEMGSHLERWGYEVRTAKDFHKVLEDVAAFEPHLILMDIVLPFYNGYYWCAEIRKLSRVPVIFVSSASDNLNIVMAINMGGDDFVTKPFDLQVLSAKIQALLRRTYDFGSQSLHVLEHKGIFLNLSDATIRYGEQKIELTKNEFRILQLLFENKGAHVSREQMMERLWDSDCFVDDNTLTVNMNRLRKKLESAGIAGLIKTKKGIGYALV